MSEARETGGYSHREGGQAEGGVDGNQAGPVRLSGFVAAQKNKEVEEAGCKLWEQHKEPLSLTLHQGTDSHLAN